MTEADRLVVIVAEANDCMQKMANAVLQHVASVNAVKTSVESLRLAEQQQTLALLALTETTLPEITRQLEVVSETLVTARAEIRDVAQVVVGQGEIHADTLEHVKSLAADGRDQAAVAVAVSREVTSEVKTFMASGEAGKRTGAAAAIREVSQGFRAFGGLPVFSQIVLAILVAVAIAGWTLRGIGH